MHFLDTQVENKSLVKQEKFPVFRVFLFLFGLFLLNLLFSSSVSAATPPSIITYQGKLLDGGTSVNATTSIQLRIYDDPAAGNLLYTAGGTIGVPDEIDVPVDNGIFSVNMGAAGTNAVTSSIFSDNSALYLEVWIEGNQMSPRKRLNSVPFALNSAYLMGYSPATSATSTYIPVSDSNGNFNFFGSLTATGTATSSFTNVLVTDGITLGGEKRTEWPSGGGIEADDNTTFTGMNTFASGTFFSATSTFNQKALFLGGATTSTIAGRLVSSTLFSGAAGVEVRGSYAYMTSYLDDNFSIIDISSSTNPVLLSNISTGAFTRPNEVVLSGNYAFVSKITSDINVYDVSNPKNPVLMDTLSDPFLSGPRGLTIYGNYLLVVDHVGDSLFVFDISDPLNGRVIKRFDHNAVTGPLIDQPWSVRASGNYVFVTSEESDSLSIFDFSDPKDARFVTSTSGTMIDGAHGLAVSDRYAYVSTGGHAVSDRIQIYDISNPSAPVAMGSSTVGSGDIASLEIADNYLYLVEAFNLFVLDVTDPNDIIVKTSLSGVGSANQFSGGRALALQGNYAYIARYGAEELAIVDITGVDITNADIGNASISNLKVQRDSTFNGAISIRGGLNIGNGGLLLNGSFGMFSPTSSVFSTNTLQFSNTALFQSMTVSTDTHAFIFNTGNSLTIATSTYLFSVRNNGTPTFSISSAGDVHTTGTYYGNAVAVSTPGTPGDLAERVDIAQDDVVEPGDVVVVDPNSTDTYRRSNSPYAQEVSGVISTNPTIVVGDGRTEHTAVMAMVGRVPVKVSAENGPIIRGDLLITATSTGYAMRYDASKDNSGQIAGIVGVALESLPEGKGKIMGLVRTGWVNGQGQQVFSEMRSEIAKLSLAEPMNNNFNVSENNNGDIVRIENDVDLRGFSLLSVKSIHGLNGKWEIDEEGRFTTTVDTREGTKTLYALQSGENQYVFSGSGELINGKARIDFEDTLLDIIDVDRPMSINLTLTQKAKGIYVSGRDDEGFDVEEVVGGSSNATFDWLIFATRKNAPEAEEELDEEEEPVVDQQPIEEENNESGDAQVPEPEVDEESLPEENNDEVIDGGGDDNEPPVQEQEEEVLDGENEDEEVVEDDPVEEPVVEEQPATEIENDSPPAEPPPTE